MYSTSRSPSGRPSTKQKSQRLPQRRMRAGSTATPSGSLRGRSISNSISSPQGCRTCRLNSSSALRNSQSRKSSSSRPFTDRSSVPGRSPSSSPIEPACTAVTLIIPLPGIVASPDDPPAASAKDGPNFLKYQDLGVQISGHFAGWNAGGGGGRSYWRALDAHHGRFGPGRMEGDRPRASLRCPAPFEDPVSTIGERPQEEEKPRQRDSPPDCEHFRGKRPQRARGPGGQSPPIADGDGEAEEGCSQIHAGQREQRAAEPRLALERRLDEGADDNPDDRSREDSAPDRTAEGADAEQVGEPAPERTGNQAMQESASGHSVLPGLGGEARPREAFTGPEKHDVFLSNPGYEKAGKQRRRFPMRPGLRPGPVEVHESPGVQPDRLQETTIRL